MIKEFRDFISRGNVVDLAIAVIVGSAFGKIVTSFVNDVFMPPIGLLLGKVDFTNLFIDLSGAGYTTLEQAQAAGAPTINYGLFINTIIDFVVISLVIFAVIKMMAKVQKPAPVVVASTKECPFCCSPVPIKAVRCPNCTSDLKS